VVHPQQIRQAAPVVVVQVQLVQMLFQVLVMLVVLV
jgi:hypothetical protein